MWSKSKKRAFRRKKRKNVMTNYIQYHIAPCNDHESREAERVINKFASHAVVIDGVVTWKSNGQVPPKEMLDFWKYLGYDFDYQKSIEVQESQISMALQEYRERQNHLSSEDKALQIHEARAAVGPGVKMIDVITGRTFTT